MKTPLDLPKCVSCGGTGTSTWMVRCEKCYGRGGWLENERGELANQYEAISGYAEWVACERCHGVGEALESCKACKGTGKTIPE